MSFRDDTTIRVKKSTVELIKQHGEFGESYDDVLVRIFEDLDNE